MHRKPPTLGCFKVNTDTAFKDGAAALAVVLRDCNGKVLYLSSPAKAELKAIVWALEIAEAKSWINLIWSFDAQSIVKETNSSLDPS